MNNRQQVASQYLHDAVKAIWPNVPYVQSLYTAKDRVVEEVWSDGVQELRAVIDSYGDAEIEVRWEKYGEKEKMVWRYKGSTPELLVKY